MVPGAVTEGLRQVILEYTSVPLVYSVLIDGAFAVIPRMGYGRRFGCDGHGER